MSDRAGAWRRMARPSGRSGTTAVRERLVQALVRHQGEYHTETLGACNDLGVAYHEDGRHSDAVEVFDRTLAHCRRVLGPEHPDTLVVEANLAVGQLSTGRCESAVELLEQNVTARERVLGEQHPSTLAARRGLAIAHLAAEEQPVRTQPAAPRPGVPVVYRLLGIGE